MPNIIIKMKNNHYFAIKKCNNGRRKQNKTRFSREKTYQ